MTKEAGYRILTAQVFTVGVYGASESTFFKALVDHRISHFVDVRRRRGLRGPKYAFANATALQRRLAELGIGYEHRLDLAPTMGTRSIQRSIDHAVGTTKLDRMELAPEFIASFRSDCLNLFSPKEFLAAFPEDARLVLFCVENQPQSCHRSLIAREIQSKAGHPWRDITPTA